VPRPRSMTTGLRPQAGHFMADLGFEHFFNRGMEGCLAPGSGRRIRSIPRIIRWSIDFRQWMAVSAKPEGISRQEHAKNIQQLFNWVEAIERGRCPWARSELWSEGEGEFLKLRAWNAILAQRLVSFQSWTKPNSRSPSPQGAGKRLELLEQAFWWSRSGYAALDRKCPCHGRRRNGKARARVGNITAHGGNF